MCILVVGYAFSDDPMKGGEGVRIDFRRCQAARIALKDVYESYRDDNGNLRYYTQEDHDADPTLGRKKRCAGEPYWVEASVCGTDAGDSKNPKFSLRR